MCPNDNMCPYQAQYVTHMNDYILINKICIYIYIDTQHIHMGVCVRVEEAMILLFYFFGQGRSDDFDNFFFWSKMILITKFRKR